MRGGRAWSLSAWSCVVVRGRACSCVVVRGRAWSCVVVRGRAWSCAAAVRGHGRAWSAWSCAAVVCLGHWSLTAVHPASGMFCV